MSVVLVRTSRRELEAALPEGFQLEESRGHYFVIRPNGEKLRASSGLPIKICSTPSDYRTRKNEFARIRQALRA